ncbi:hypothetical protein C2E23DRAFT_771292 [Lenzites betulinus]|nr:hypothetical protein C2E23DRAFT_771292 [Lenzites betulinus]
MDAWPGYCHGQEGATANKGKAKAGKDERIEDPWRYPILEHGSVGAATLKKKGKRYDWSFVAESRTDYKLVAPDGPIEVFPPTRPQPWRSPNATELQRAEQGAHFLRTFYPDIDVQTEVIRDEIAEASRAARVLASHDPFSGNMIDISSFHISRKNMVYVAFPMGPTNCQLNMSPLTLNTRTKVNLKPVAKPVHTFDTPIRQIITTPHLEIGKGKPAPMIGVRTMGSTMFMQIQVAVDKTTYAVQPAPYVTVLREDIGNRHVMDMAFSRSNTSVGYVVNDAGAIFQCSAPEGKRTIELVHIVDASERSLYRIAASDARDTLLSLSDRSALLLDLRASKKVHILYEAPKSQVVLTSIESSNEDNIIRLISSNEMVWLDGRNTRKPLLSVKHGREFDTTLSSHTQVMISSPLTFLTSRRNSLVTVYDVSRGNDNLVHVHDAPYSLPPIHRPDGAHLGYAFFQPPTLAGSKHLSIFQLSERGGLSLLNIQRVPREASHETSKGSHQQAEWPDEVKKLEEDADAAKHDLGPLAGRGHSVVDLQTAYQKLFIQREEKSLSAQTNVAFDVLEHMSSFWQDAEIPVEHALTTFDIAMRSGPEPVDASRNDWFTGSALDCVAGYRALQQGRIPRHQLTQKAPWHLEVPSIIRRSVPGFADELPKMLENLSSYDLADGPGRTAPSFRRESEARQQLALDLSLSSDVFLHKRPGKNTAANFDEDVNNISRSTQAMSLSDLEPAPVQFSFLRPIRKAGKLDAGENAVDDLSGKPTMPSGVRLLLQEWEVGTDPWKYEYRDPYDEAGPTPAARFQPPAKTATAQDAQLAKEPRPAAQTLSQRPPVTGRSISRAPPTIGASQPAQGQPRRPLVAAKSLDSFVAPASRPPPSASQPQPAETWSAPKSSQEFVTSTQVLPGAHGGRPAPVKKKTAKKRLGGF